MLARRRMIGRVLWWGLLWTAAAVGYVNVKESLPTNSGKVRANTIVSPWDVSAAPPPFVKRHQIRMKPAHIPTVEAPIKHDRRNGRRRQVGIGRETGDIVDARVSYRYRHMRRL